MNTIKVELNKDLDKKFYKQLKDKELSESEYINDLIKKDLDSTIDLGEGFYYNKYLDKLFNPNEKEIPLTRIEKELMLALLESKGDIVTIEELSNRAWRKDDVSIFTFRNMIKKFRDKTYYALIVNHSNKGYSILLDN